MMGILLRFLIIFSVAWLAFEMLKVIKLWVRSKVAGIPVSVFTLCRWQLGRTQGESILEAFASATHGGLDVSIPELEQLAHLGGDPVVVIQEMVRAKASGANLSFKDAANQNLAAKPANVIRIQRGGRGGGHQKGTHNYFD